MECGDPKGKWGRGFVPIQGEYLFQLKQKQVSVYTCHTPLDVHPEISTNRAIAQVLNVKPEAEFFHTEQGACGLIGTLPPISTDELIARSQRIFSIPYVDFAGKKQEAITQIAIVAGCGDRTEVMEEAEAKGAQAYLTGEIHCHIDNEYGKYRYRQMMDYIPNTSMSLIGVSHAASEFLVMKIQMKKWFERHFALESILLPQQLWWL
jgi:putative NIF3 family GTP cyclohydrolase 1 type 2